MRLDLEVVAVLEDVGVPRCGLDGGIVFVLEQVGGDLPGHAGRGDDDALAVLREQLAVDARLGVEAFGVCERRQLHEVAIPRLVLREQDEVIVRLLERTVRARAGAAITGSDIGLHPDDRLDLFFPRVLLELPGCMQITVIGNRQGGLLEFLGPSDQIVDPVRAVEKGVFGMAVEVYEGHREEDSDPRHMRQRKPAAAFVV